MYIRAKAIVNGNLSRISCFPIAEPEQKNPPFKKIYDHIYYIHSQSAELQIIILESTFMRT